MKPSLPQELSKENKYKYFSFGSSLIKETVQPLNKKGGVFYLGADENRFDRLAEILDGKYGIQHVTSTNMLIKRIKESRAIPETIMVDSKMGKKTLREVYNYLTSVNQFSGTPLLLDASELNSIELKEYRKLPYIDEITFLKDVAPEKLVAKIAFLRKVKTKANTETITFTGGIKKVNKTMKTATSNVFKRAFDILFSSLAILVLLPVYIIIAIAIRVESKGPIFYIASRAGRGYKIFKFYKFRTMIVDADKKVKEMMQLNQYTANSTAGPVFFKVSNDPRITKVGAFLRNTSLDELPQLFNVLLGDMSLVGNRPLPLYEAATLTTDQHAIRFMAPAGITGLWQIKKRGASNMSVEERINLDIDYAHKSNFIYDLWIIANTPSALLQKESV